MPDTPAFNTISVIGLGYIGLPTATVFAASGVNVIGVDVNAEAVATINRGEIHIIEPDLDQAVHSAVEKGLLRATTIAEPADAFMIAVPTPFKGSNHDPDLRYIEAATKAIAPVLQPGNLIVLESTSPVGATEKMAEWLAKARTDLSFPQQAGEQSDIRIAYCPERVLPGKVMQELISNDRIIGGMTPRCATHAEALYRIFVQSECIITDARTAEMCKLSENAFRDLNIAYANELSTICDRLDINVWELIRLANRHPRVNILQPGAGVGGHCIAVDPWFIVSSAPEQARLIRTVRETNDAKPLWVLDKVRNAAIRYKRDHGRAPVVAALGLSFKADIDDLRESPALAIAQQLHGEMGDRFVAVEPHIRQLPETMRDARLLPLEQAVEQADILVILVRHSLFNMFFRDATAPWNKIFIDAAGLNIAEIQQQLIADSVNSPTSK